ncbi:MAG: isoleucine--tRNA ligase [Alphaproteobacteria bacterium]|jgi:isoleucine--tRNA ligase|uniref:isoleucine--tRNA ligase n=1 Tax=Candidatus Scatocola faecigallinarum TaxID=2840916 RepID=UPI00033BDE56|nr:isoleucine--tRNA ligase [Azospirillum sp. CAG:239]
MTKHYKEVKAKADFVEIEKEVLKFWDEDKTFEKSVHNRDGAAEFVFYDGPPFANGTPHYGHIMVSYVKDVVARYQTMNGKKVERRLGWDCHGLPAEMSAEKQLGVSGRKQIEEYGVEKFNDFCRSDVLKYSGIWVEMFKRIGRWVDFSHDYKTMDLPFMESVINNFKQLWEKGLVYEDYRVLPYSWAAETPLSNFEVNQGYQDKTDNAITVMFTLENGMKMLVWTTTPWTLPSNLMLAVGKDIDYAVMEEDGQKYVLAQALLGRYKKQLEHATQVGTMKGADFVGMAYEPMFPYFKHLKEKGAFRVLSGEFVSTEDGTGIVHIAPGFGQDDFEACRAYDENFPVVCPVDEAGKFTAEVPDYQGKQVFETNEPIMQLLKEKGILVKKEQYTHSYPFCWRTDTPLIYKAMSSWFVKVTDFRDDMVRNNQQITWVPEHIKDGRFGKWLEGARDWSISRNRFWGTPIPVWKSDNPQFPRIDVFGSVAEIKEKTGIEVTNLHKPYIDEVVYPNPDDPSGKTMMRRVGDVFDCWFESGSMPYAQVHYPFDNKEWFENHFPADFIVEAMDQTRGWFYTLTVLSTALHNKPAFKNCICTGLLMAEGGQKLSKRLKNYPDPNEVLDSIGSDALRWFLVSSPVLKGGNLAVDQEGKEIAKAARVAQIPMWNAYYFFTLYANAEGYQAKEVSGSSEAIDNYILSKLKRLSRIVKQGLDTYDVALSCNEVASFMEILNNWYIRRTRDRFWSGDQQAFDVLYTVLVNLSKIMAPLMPFLCEYVYKNLTGGESVHLADYPQLENIKLDETLVDEMDFLQDLCSAGKFIREEKNLRNRLPLAGLTVVGDNLGFLNGQYQDIIKDELNVKEVKIDNNLAAYAAKTVYLYTPLLGKALGKDMGPVMAAYKQGKWELNADGTLSIAGQTLTPDLFEVRLDMKDGVAGKAFADNKAVVTLNTNVTDELKREGMARDFVRLVQTLRKDKDFNISDRIELCYATDNAELNKALDENKAYVAEQVLAVKVSSSCAGGTKADIEGAEIVFDAKVTDAKVA